MASFTYVNFVNTTVAAALSSTATTVTLSSTAGLPASIPAGAPIVFVLNDAATRAVFEVVYATAISGANLTIERGQEGTTAQAWAVNDYIFASNSAGLLGSLAPLASPAFTGSPTAPTPAAASNNTQLATTAWTRGYAAALNGSSSEQFNASGFLASEGTGFNGTVGYSFQGDGSYDTGMFSSSDGYIQFYTNAILAATANGGVFNFPNSPTVPPATGGNAAVAYSQLFNGSLSPTFANVHANAVDYTSAYGVPNLNSFTYRGGATNSSGSSQNLGTTVSFTAPFNCMVFCVANGGTGSGLVNGAGFNLSGITAEHETTNFASNATLSTGFMMGTAASGAACSIYYYTTCNTASVVNVGLTYFLIPIG